MDVEEALSYSITDKLSKNQKGVESCVSDALEMLVIKTVGKILNSPELINEFSCDLIDRPEAGMLGTTLVKSEQQYLVTGQSEIKKICG